MEEGGTNGAHYVSGQESARWRLCNGKRRWRVQAGKPDTLVKRTRGARLLYNGDLAAAAAVELNQGRRSNGPCTPTVQPRRSGLPAAQKRVLTVLPQPGMLNDTQLRHGRRGRRRAANFPFANKTVCCSPRRCHHRWRPDWTRRRSFGSQDRRPWHGRSMMMNDAGKPPRALPTVELRIRNISAQVAPISTRAGADRNTTNCPSPLFHRRLLYTAVWPCSCTITHTPHAACPPSAHGTPGGRAALCGLPGRR